jgi:hypothetical protein
MGSLSETYKDLAVKRSERVSPQRALILSMSTPGRRQAKAHRSTWKNLGINQTSMDSQEQQLATATRQAASNHRVR